MAGGARLFKKKFKEGQRGGAEKTRLSMLSKGGNANVSQHALERSWPNLG